MLFVLGGLGAALIAAAASSEPPKGMALLKLPTTKEALAAELTFVGGWKVTVTTKGAVVKPGTYDVKSVVLMMADDRKNVWQLAGGEKAGNLERFMVDADQEKVLDVGPPILFRMRAWRPGADTPVHITVDAVGRSRESYFPGAAPPGQRAQPLAFQVVDEDGKTVLASGRMTFADGVSSHSWQPARGYAGKFTVKIAPEMGPFEWKYYEDYTGAAAR
jgi:hypothetical protein